jgi:hypothetical protein
VQEKFTIPLNPAVPATLTCVETGWPEIAVSDVEPPLPLPRVSGAFTVCVSVPLAATLFASPLYAAVMVWLPALEKLVV